MSWVADAACRGMDTALFFPTREQGKVSDEAKEACRRCPVSDECLREALALPRDDDFGYRAGTSAIRRDRIRRGEAAPVAARVPAVPRHSTTAQCGTESGYRRHRDHGEPYCEPCREAKNLAATKTWKRCPMCDAEVLITAVTGGALVLAEVIHDTHRQVEWWATLDRCRERPAIEVQAAEIFPDRLPADHRWMMPEAVSA